jgi:hypothetical protein
MQQQIDHDKNKLNSLNKEIHEFQPWGNFSVEDIKKLEERGFL